MRGPSFVEQLDRGPLSRDEIAARIAATFLLAPLPGGAAAGIRVRAAFVCLLAMLLAPTLHTANSAKGGGGKSSFRTTNWTNCTNGTKPWNRFVQVVQIIRVIRPIRGMAMFF